MSSVAHQQQPVFVYDNRHSMGTMQSSFAPYILGMHQQQPYIVTAAAASPLLIQGLTPNSAASQPASVAIYHAAHYTPTPAISLLAAAASTPATTHPVAAAVSAMAVPPSSLSALRTRRESRPTKALRGGAEIMCREKQCGMRFASDEALVEHITRLHINNRDIYRKPHITVAAAVAAAAAAAAAAAHHSKQHRNGTQQTKDKVKQSSTARGKQGQVRGEKVRRSSKRPHAATNGSGEKSGRQKVQQQNGGRKRQEERRDSDDGSDISSDSSDSSDSDISSDTSDSDSMLDTDDSISDSDDSSSSSEDEKGGGPFERFGHALSSNSSSANSDSDSNSSADSSPRRTRRSSTSRRPVRTPTVRRPRSARPSTTSDPSSSSSSPAATAHPTVSRDPRVERIHKLNYLYKFRQPATTPTHSLRCVLCNIGLHPNLGLLLSCHGGCTLSFHQQCMEMWTVPSGPWYCSDECVREECRVKEDGSEDIRLDTDLKFLYLVRRWQNCKPAVITTAACTLLTNLINLRAHRCVVVCLCAGCCVGYFKKKKKLQTGVVSNRESKQRFIVPLICTVPRCPSFPSESRWADAFPPARLPAAPLVRRIFYPLSLSANPDAYTNSTTSIELAEQGAQSSEQQQSITSTTTPATAATSSALVSPAETPRPRRPHHLMFSLKQPRSDPTDFVPTYPNRYAAKGQKQVTSSRSLRSSHSSLRSAAFLLSLRVPDRDPNIAICCVCENGDSIDDNPIILCDGPCCMAYHRHCVGLSHMPKEEDVWCCSDVCKRARVKNSAVEDDVVVRLVQRRRDEYDARGPYRGLYEEGKGGEAANAELLEQFAQLDAQYFCPRVITRLWRKGKWRLQRVELQSMMEVMEVVGEVSGKWKLRVEEDGSGMDGKAMVREDWVEEQADPASDAMQIDDKPATNKSAAATVDGMLGDTAAAQVDAVMTDSVLLALKQVEGMAAAVTVNTPHVEPSSASAPSSPAVTAEPISTMFRSASIPAALPSNTEHNSSDMVTTTTTDPTPLHLIEPTSLPPTTPSAQKSLVTALNHPTRTVSDPTTTSSTTLSATHEVLTEEQRLLAAYHTQVLANNSTKSRLLTAFNSHKLITPQSLNTLTTQQHADELTLRTYLEYEEKHSVGNEKDRQRRQLKCHVNYCRCNACYNAHLVVEEEDGSDDEEGEVVEEQDERERVEAKVDEGGEVLDESQLDGDEDEAEARVEEQQPAAPPVPAVTTSVASSTAFLFPPSLRPITGSIHPSALLRFIDHSLRHRDEYLALAKSVSSAEVAMLLEAGGKGARTFTRQQLRAKRDEESVESGRQHTRRRGGMLFQEESSPSPPPADGSRANTELMSLQKWGWDRNWRQRVEAGLIVDPHITRSRGKAAQSGMVDVDEDGGMAAGDVLPRGHARLRITFRGKGVFTSRDSEYDDHHLPIVRFKPRRQHRGAHSLKLKFKRTGRDMTVVDGDGVRGVGRGSVAVRFVLGASVRLVSRVGGRVGEGLRQLRANWSTQQHQQSHSAALSAESVPNADMDVSATEATSRAAALATEMVLRLQALQQEPPPLTAEQKKQKWRDNERARKQAEREKKEREKVKRVAERERQKERRSRQVNVHCQVLENGDVLANIVINERYRWPVPHRTSAATEIDALHSAWPQDMLNAAQPLLDTAAENDSIDGLAAPQQPSDTVQAQAEGDAARGEETGRPHRTRHFTQQRLSTQPSGEQESIAGTSPSINLSTAVATSSLHTLPLTPSYSRKNRNTNVGSTTTSASRLSTLDFPPTTPTTLLPRLPEPETYALDANGLPIITDPIPDDICLVCGHGGDVLLCDGTINGIPCVRCYHLQHCDPPLKELPEGEWRCSMHSCSACGGTDTERACWPFTYCEWCDKSWCATCVSDSEKTGELFDWTPKAETEQARWVCCRQCVMYFRKTHKMKDGDDFRAPDRQQRAHKQKVEGQLRVLEKLRKEQEQERKAAEVQQQTKKKRGRKPAVAAVSVSEKKRPAAQQPVKANKRRKSDGAAMHADVQQLKGNEDDEPLQPRRRGRPRRSKVEQQEQHEEEQVLDDITVKVEGENEDVRVMEEGEDERYDEAEGGAANGVHLTGGSRASSLSTVSDMQSPSPSPPPLVLQPCISRSEQSSTRRQLHRQLDRTHTSSIDADDGADDGEETDEETPTLVDDAPLTLGSGRTATRRNAARGGGHSGGGRGGGGRSKRAKVMNGLNGHTSSPTVTVPSPSSLASLPCLSTSSSASTITSTSSSPIPLPGTPDSAGSEGGGRSSLQLLSPPPPKAADLLLEEVSVGRRSTRRGNAIEHANDRQIAQALERQLNSGWAVQRPKLTVTPKKRSNASSPAKVQAAAAAAVAAVDAAAASISDMNGHAAVDGVEEGREEAGDVSSATRSGSKRLRAR